MTSRQRTIARCLLLIFFGDLLAPTVSIALTSGPSQPEVQGFQPANVDNSVDLFSGNFSYNIPLFDVEGYPVNLFYNAGIGMDQEASWVGLGWNLNPGVVERSLRGLPDDFSGDLIRREIDQKKNWTLGVGMKATFEMFGFNALPDGAAGTGAGVTLGLSLSPSFNSYEGMSVETGVSMGFRSTQANKCQFNGELGLTSHSDRGLRLQPRVGFGRKMGSDYVAGLNFGLSLDSRQGLTNVSFGVDLTRTQENHFCHPTNSNEDRSTIKEMGRLGTNASFDIGAPTYTPEVSVPMTSTSLAFNVTAGGSLFGAHPNMRWSAFYSTMKVRDNVINRPAYGYLHLGNASISRSAMLDFNREKDGPYSPDKAALGIAQLTNDVFNVSGQGMSGSYRAFRSDVGNVFDPYTFSNSDGFTAGAEVGGGNLAHGGADVMINQSNSHSGKWSAGNDVAGALAFRQEMANANTEVVYFREAGEHTLERDPSLWNSMQGATAMGFNMARSGGQNATLKAQLTSNWTSNVTVTGPNYRTKREARSQLFTYLTNAEARKFAVEPGLVAADLVTSSDPNEVVPKPHHMSEVTILGEGGQRYVYGQPVYNMVQEDVEFSTTNAPDGSGLVAYTTTDASMENTMGREHFYSKTITPAYPYAFLLTSVLSNDYSDIDGTVGPSPGDLGNYTHFIYTTATNNFKWRTPSAPLGGGASVGYARLSRGRLADPDDDKGVYTYGEKQLKYLNVIESRNMRAVFITSDRKDGLQVDEFGKVHEGVKPKQLDKIEIYTLGRDVNGNPVEHLVKTVHFEYDYSLCPGTPNTHTTNSTRGKLTLLRVWFTYGTSGRGATSPYVFNYGTGETNPTYDANAQDRWGCYKPDFFGTNSGSLGNQDYPYAEQDRERADQNARAWNLSTITTPSGGVIRVEYEADDYAFVQDRRAMTMYRMTTNSVPELFQQANEHLVFLQPPPGFPTSDPEAISAALASIFSGVQEVYFRVSVGMSNGSGALNERVSGYCEMITGGENTAYGYDPGSQRLWMKLSAVSIDGEYGTSGTKVSAPYRAALEYAQLHYPTYAHQGPIEGPNDESENALIGFFESLANSVVGLVTGLGAFFNGPNQTMMNAHKCEAFIYSDSWFRLFTPNDSKMGGGHRVARIRFSDSWTTMQPSESDESFTYGKSYTYGDENGSFGVASYEPMVGADENPFRRPVGGVANRVLSPDEKFYQEEPFGEAMFPSASVGYSRVIVRDLYWSGSAELPETDPVVRQQGTGTTVHEFYTARDFPTRVAATKLQTLPLRNQGNLLALVGFKRFDHMHASQGFTVETNDMHGKPKMTSIYRQGSAEAISSVRYVYQTTMENGQGPLSNTATVIDRDGQISQAEIGRLYEFVADTREFDSKGSTGGIQANLDGFILGIIPAGVPVAWPKFSSESTRFKTGVLVKKVHRAGLLQKVVKMDNGSTVTNENLAYDAQTGAVLLTRTNNDFDDPVYSMRFPAYWHYDGMGPAYTNIGTVFPSVTFDSQGRASVSNAHASFVAGDECALVPTGSGNAARGWVDEVRPNGITMINASGAPVAGTYRLKILRSGRRNMQGQDMMTLLSYTDPLSGLSGNVYSNIVDAKAVDFGSEWNVACDCTGPRNTYINAWRSNGKGVWRLSRERAWLADRTRSITNRNTSIRSDGVYSEFSPLYNLVGGTWQVESSGWVVSRFIRDYNALGKELENMDALGIPSAAQFGHGGTLPIAVARNAFYREIGFTSFEEPTQPNCNDKHFVFSSVQHNAAESHSGRRAAKVSNTPLQLTTPQSPCYAQQHCKSNIRPRFNTSTIRIDGTNAMAEVIVDVLEGSAVFDSNGTFPDLSFQANGPWVARITAIDITGCRYSLVINSRHHTP